MGKQREHLVPLGAASYDSASGALRGADGQTIALRPQSLSVLKHLVAKNGEIALRDDIIAEVWGNVHVTDDSLVQCIADIRKAIGSQGREVIQTVPKKGYRLVAGPESAAAGSGHGYSRASKLIAASFVVLSILIAAGFVFAPSKPSAGSPAIAVLPFANLGGDEGQVYFTDGFSRAITTNLSRFSDLFVVSSFSSFKFRSSKESANHIARKLGVRYLLTGDVQPGAERVVINAQLTDARDGKSLWAERYAAPRKDILQVQDELSAKIAATLVERLEAATTRKARASTQAALSAYELVLRTANPKIEKKALMEANGLIEQALKLAPDFARAHAKHALIHLLLWRHSLSDDHPGALRKARAAATRAISLDANSYQAHQVLSMIYLYADKDHALALASITKALEINPNEADLMVRYSTLLGFMDRDSEAIEWSEKAMRQHPLHPVWYHWNAAFVYAVAHKNERAIVESKKALAVHKTSASIRRILIAAHGQRGEWEEAKRYAAEILEHFPKFRLSTHMRNSPFQHEEERKHYWDLFRKAGLPD